MTQQKAAQDTQANQARHRPAESHRERSRSASFVDPCDLSTLQHQAGNQAVQRLIRQRSSNEWNALEFGSQLGKNLGIGESEHTERSENVIQRQDGPQSYAGERAGVEPVDGDLAARNRQIEAGLLEAAEEYYDSGDLRWFFAYAHGIITQQINGNLSSFQRPNALLLLNIHFAEEFLRAVYGMPHDHWRETFRLCNVLETHAETNYALVGEAEICGAMMANVHINIDLANALQSVGCIPPADYGNVLVFVNQGALAAQARLRGRMLGAVEAMVQYFVAPMLDMEVEVWRNGAYAAACNTEVPEVEPSFNPSSP